MLNNLRLQIAGHFKPDFFCTLMLQFLIYLNLPKNNKKFGTSNLKTFHVQYLFKKVSGSFSLKNRRNQFRKFECQLRMSHLSIWMQFESLTLKMPKMKWKFPCNEMIRRSGGDKTGIFTNKLFYEKQLVYKNSKRVTLLLKFSHQGPPNQIFLEKFIYPPLWIVNLSASMSLAEAIWENDGWYDRP